MVQSADDRPRADPLSVVDHYVRVVANAMSQHHFQGGPDGVCVRCGCPVMGPDQPCVPNMEKTFEDRITAFDRELLGNMCIEAPPVSPAERAKMVGKEAPDAYVVAYNYRDAANATARYPNLRNLTLSVIRDASQLLDRLVVGATVYVTYAAHHRVDWPTLDWAIQQRQLEVVYI